MGGKGRQSARRLNTMTVHYGPHADNYMIHSSETGDFTQWQCAAVAGQTVPAATMFSHHISSMTFLFGRK